LPGHRIEADSSESCELARLDILIGFLEISNVDHRRITKTGRRGEAEPEFYIWDLQFYLASNAINLGTVRLTTFCRILRG